jgi:hypothetical protein
VSAYYTTCVLVRGAGVGDWYIRLCILLYTSPCTATYVSAYYTTCVLILHHMCPHTTIYLSAYCYACVLIQLNLCVRITIIQEDSADKQLRGRVASEAPARSVARLLCGKLARQLRLSAVQKYKY